MFIRRRVVMVIHQIKTPHNNKRLSTYYIINKLLFINIQPELESGVFLLPICNSISERSDQNVSKWC
ncbi:hypothetical protein NQ317_005587 [Molorchus minor]|uniref:Uncharacterized protein n=1 Tax=Molorchus minor TaxID=1323400 RepID=A0ABQ9K7W7_9CUCU|nr:hypothetical protein NQ317_005587 [Molorchus minor]